MVNLVRNGFSNCFFWHNCLLANGFFAKNACFFAFSSSLLSSTFDFVKPRVSDSKDHVVRAVWVCEFEWYENE